MAVKSEKVKEVFDELNSTVKLMGDGKFEDWHWAGDVITAQVLDQLARVEAVKGAGIAIAMMGLLNMMMRNKDASEADKEHATTAFMEEPARQASLIFLAGYRLGRKEAEVEQIERMLE